MATRIAKSADVDPRAEIADGVEIGPFSYVGPDVTIGPGTKLDNNVTLTGVVSMGANNRVFPGAVIGAEPQDLSYRGAKTRVVIGDNNVFREGVTINRATEKEEWVTSIGNNCYFMALAHVAHDCRVADNVIIVNGSMLGGHVHVHDHATISGGSAVHHFATVGAYAFVSGISRCLHDVPPYMLVEGLPARPRCINVVGLKRNSFSADEIRALSEAHRVIFRNKVGLDHAREILRSNNYMIPVVNRLLGFIQSQQEGQHGRGRQRRRAAA